MKRRLPAALLIAALIVCLLPSAAHAEGDASFLFDAYVGLHGRPVTIAFLIERRADVGDGTVRLLGGDGAQLAAVEGCRAGQSYAFRFDVDASYPAGQTISLRLDGAETDADTALFAVDSVDHYPVYGVRTTQKLIAFTFSSSNGASNSERILDILDGYGAKCTFFIQGTYAENNPALTRQIAERGHELGSHSYGHLSMRETNAHRAYRDLRRAITVIEAASGQTLRVYRPPGGSSTFRDCAISRALGLEVIKWTVDSRDGFKDLTCQNVIDRVTGHAFEGSIVQFHVYGRHTPEALEYLLPYYQEQGYRFVTVSDLLSLYGEETAQDAEHWLIPVGPQPHTPPRLDPRPSMPPL